jgi:hypothetical protein
VARLAEQAAAVQMQGEAVAQLRQRRPHQRLRGVAPAAQRIVDVVQRGGAHRGSIRCCELVEAFVFVRHPGAGRDPVTARLE